VAASSEQLRKAEERLGKVEQLVGQAVLQGDDAIRLDALKAILSQKQGPSGVVQMMDSSVLEIMGLISTLESLDTSPIARRKAELKADEIIRAAPD
jgi:hypothetical protein